MGIDSESDVSANLQIGPTSLGMVRIYVEGDGFLSLVGSDWTLTIPAANALGDGTYDVEATVWRGEASAVDAGDRDLTIDLKPPPVPTQCT